MRVAGNVTPNLAPQFGAVLTFSALIALNGIPELHASPIYFLVAEPREATVHMDSYVLPLTAPGDIAHARDLAANGPAIGGAIVVARIAAGSDGLNRDYRARGAPLWSWHVTEFMGFADFAAEILDGWPSFVESDVEGWIANTGGLIGFWSYTVVAELEELSVPAPGTLWLFLSGLGGVGWFRLRRRSALR